MLDETDSKKVDEGLLRRRCYSEIYLKHLELLMKLLIPLLSLYDFLVK